MSRSRRQKKTPGARMGRCMAGGVLLGGASFLASAVLVASGFFLYAKHFLQSERFQAIVEDKLSSALKSEVELGGVSWEGTSAFSERAGGQGWEDASFSRFGLAGLRAQLDLSVENFRRRVWKIPELTISQLDVVFSGEGRVAKKSAAAQSTPEGDSGAEEGSENLLSGFIPRELELDEVRINTLNLYWESPEARTGATGMQAVLRPRSDGQGYGVNVHGGVIQGAEVPKLEIDVLEMQWSGSRLFLDKANLRSPDGALLRLDGEVNLGETDKPGSMLLNAEVTQLAVARLSQGRGPSRVQGDLAINARIEGNPRDLKSCRQEGQITLRNGVVETLPVLVMLARFTGSKRFERIALRDGGGAKFVREKGRTVFSGIDFQSDGLGRLTGDLVVENGNLDGLVQLGVIPGTLAWIPTAEQKIFTESRDGHLWTPVRVTGTVEHPRQDLTERLTAAGVEAAVDVIGRFLEGGAKGGEAGAKDPKSAPEGTEPLGNALELGRELLKGFFR